ncbi:MAG TPA: Smr/MutS family protein [Acetobacteraceae bacterium]|nr:Smr/MutS family protein [Acetobacteraceae bacterium]
MQQPRRTRLTEADRALWAIYTGSVRPMRGRAPIPARREQIVVSPDAQRPAAPALVVRVPLAPLSVGAQPGGVDTASWQRLRTGKLSPTRTLDLHGHTAQRAHRALSSFLRTAQAEGVRCVEIVTGQGAVLRRELMLWLNQPEFRGLVLAAAHPHAANPGAVRLLLRRTR